MKIRVRYPWKPEPKQSFLENAKVVVPLLYDQFISHAGTVMSHPRLIDRLHRMRINGKPLRYLLELFDERSGKQFQLHLAEFKSMIELMGKIHDCDVLIALLQDHLQEVRIFNQGRTNREERISTRGIRELIRQQREHRTSMFAEMCSRLTAWRDNNFKEQLMDSMPNNRTITNHNHFTQSKTYGNILLETCTSG